MQIDLPTSDQARLAEHARAAGYDDVGRYAADSLIALAQHPTPSELAPIDAGAAEAMIRRGEEDLAAGRTRDMREALLELGAKRGFKAGP